ncbi:MAG TPA: hypothetical protein VKG79_00080 [Bryobacteraceae bacterium]|nr:hypothetical protein [Bryobacteraceae bacterium]
MRTRSFQRKVQVGAQTQTLSTATVFPLRVRLAPVLADRIAAHLDAMSGFRAVERSGSESSEVARVPGTDCLAVVESRRTNKQVRDGNHFSESSRIGVHFRRDLGHLSAEALDRNLGENRVKIIPSLLCLFRSLRAMKAVLQLDHGNR